MLRIGLVLIWAVAVWGQTQLELVARMSMRMEMKGVAVPPKEQVLRRERVSVQGLMLRMDAGDQFLIHDGAKGTVVLARGSDKSYVRTTPEKFEEALTRYAETVRRVGVQPTQKVEKMEAAAPPPFAWNGQETEGGGCRFRITVQSPLMKEPVVADSTLRVYSVPMTGAAAEAVKASAAFRMNKGAMDLGAAMGADPDAVKALASCMPKERMVVRTAALTEMNMTTPVEMKVESEMVFDLNPLPPVELGPAFFRVPEGWTEGPAESLMERVMLYLQPPPAGQ